MWVYRQYEQVQYQSEVKTKFKDTLKPETSIGAVSADKN
jgi:hypothetical protein